MAATSVWDAWQNNRESSANNKFVIFGALLQIDTPLIHLSINAFSSKVVNPSAHKRNKYGERGSPWRIPLEGCKCPYGFPLSIME